jgi:hypothetical protein
VNRWRELSFEAKAAAAMLAVVALGVGGFLAAAGLVELVEPASEASAERGVFVETVTVDRTVVTQEREVQHT